MTNPRNATKKSVTKVVALKEAAKEAGKKLTGKTVEIAPVTLNRLKELYNSAQVHKQNAALAEQEFKNTMNSYLEGKGLDEKDLAKDKKIDFEKGILTY